MGYAVEVKLYGPAAMGGGVALLLGVTGALVRRPWHDELYTLELARRPVAAILEALSLDSGPPGHYLVARLFELAGLGGITPLRLLSAVAVAVAVALLAGFASHRWGPAAGWIAAAFLAVHPVTLLAATEARAYGLLFLASAVAALSLAGDGPGRRRAVLLGAVLALACWVHALGLVLCLAVAAGTALLGRPGRTRVLGAVAAGLALQLPWLPVMLHQPPEAVAWMARIAREDGIRLLLAPLAAASPSADLSPWLGLEPAVPRLWWLAPLAGGLALAAGLAARDRRPLAVVWITAGGALLGGTFLLRPVYCPGRGDVLFTGAAVLLLAAALASRPRAGVVAAVLLAGLGAWGAGLTLTGWRTKPPGPEEGIAVALTRLAAPGDVVVTTAWWGLDVRWAMGQAGRGLEWLTFPLEAGKHPGWYDDGEAGPGTAAALLERLRREASGGRRVWIVRSPPLASDRRLDVVVGALGLVPRDFGPTGLWQLWGPAPVRRGSPSRATPRGGRSWHGDDGRGGGRGATGTGPLRPGPSRAPLRAATG